PRVRDYIGRTVAVGLRPEHFFRPDGSVPDGQRMTVPVRLVEALGSEILVHFEVEAPRVIPREAIDAPEPATGGQQFTARFDPGSPPKLGDTIDVAFHTEYLDFFDLETGKALR
ncbi:MAG: TOBE domain-containing protein, partial [Egibacteraceae bacterium]